MRSIIRASLLITALLLLPAVAFATTINFEGFPDSTQLTNQIPGLTFSNATVITAGISLNEFEFPPHSGSNVVFDDGGPMTIAFATPQPTIAGYFTYAEPLTIQAFDAANILVATTASPYSSNLALSGDPGSSPNELFTLASGAGISSVTIQGDPLGSSFTLDDLTFPRSVPEPSTLGLLATGLLCAGLARRARSR